MKMASEGELAKIDNALYCCEDCNVLFTSINSLEKHECRLDGRKVKVEHVKADASVHDVLANIEINLKSNNSFSGGTGYIETPLHNYGRLEELAAVADISETSEANQPVTASLEDLAEIANNSKTDYGSAKLEELAAIANEIKEAEGRTPDSTESNTNVASEEPENNRLMQLLKADKFQSNFKSFLDAYEEVIDQSEVVVESENTSSDTTNNSRTDGVRFSQGKNLEAGTEQMEYNETNGKELVVDFKMDGTEENGVRKIVNSTDQEAGEGKAGEGDGSFHTQVGEILRKHAQHWATPKTSYQCEFCQDSFTEHNQLLEHSMIHVAYNSEAKNLVYKCHECHETFATLAMLKNHTILHSVDTCFKCEICSKLFALKGNLIKHLKLHSGEKGYGCSECGKQFSLKGNLVKHVKLHSGEKNYQCSHCEKLFSLKGNLTKHLLTHTGEKLFQCFVCYKTFSLKGNLDKHMAIHSEDQEKFEKGKATCSICEKVLSSKSSLDKHTKAMHSEGGERPVKRQRIHVKRVKCSPKKLFAKMQGEGDNEDELLEVENEDGTYFMSVKKEDMTDGDDEMEEDIEVDENFEEGITVDGKENVHEEGGVENGIGEECMSGNNVESEAAVASTASQTEGKDDLKKAIVFASRGTGSKKLKVLKIIVIK